MAKKPQRELVEEIIKNLVESEITGIQSVAKDMAERVKKLEEHSLKIKKYADEIERLASETAIERADKSNLEELVKHLEKTLTKLQKKQAEAPVPSESIKIKTEVLVPEEKKIASIERAMVPRAKEETEDFGDKLRAVQYYTPEGFIVRKVR